MVSFADGVVIGLSRLATQTIVHSAMPWYEIPMYNFLLELVGEKKPRGKSPPSEMSLSLGNSGFVSSLFPMCHYERCSIPTCHQKVHTDPGAMMLNSFVQHTIPSPFCLVLIIWQLLHVGSGRKNVYVALSVIGMCGGYVDRY